MRISKYFDQNAIDGTNKIGEILAPGNTEYPAFTLLGCVEHVDRALAYMPPQDVKDLNMLMGVFSKLPSWFLSGFFRFMEFCFDHDLPMPGMIRLIRIGIRGLIMTLYYSGYKGREFTGKTPLEIMKFKVGVYQGDNPLADRGF